MSSTFGPTYVPSCTWKFSNAGCPSFSSELPALYELKDGKPALLNFQVHEGTYVVPKVLDKGYLALGKERFDFLQQGR